MIHIHGGSVLLNKLREAGLEGGFLEWCDVLCQGPTPGGQDADTWRRTRAAFLRRELDALDRDILGSLEAQDRALEEALEADELVLWFGPELFCQAILLYLLQWLGERKHRLPTVSLVCIDRYPGVDDQRSCTVSFLSGEQFRDVLRHRTPVGEAHFAVARAAWQAFTAASPRALERFASADSTPLAFLSPALARHLAELPAPGSGLGLTERRVLEALARGAHNADALFAESQRDEERRWLTDTMLNAVVRRLERGRAPLLERSGGFARLTPLAQDVLAGRRDWIALNGIDRWVGGVHLTPDRVWRWEGSRGGLVAP